MNTTPCPRPEYPRMQFRREDAWMNLNGPWAFAMDAGQSGKDRRFQEHPELFNLSITVPFAPESPLSGIGNRDFCPSVWYCRDVTPPAGWAGKRVLLHCGAVDYDATVYVDGVKVGDHFGGSVSFTVDVTDHLKPGETHQLVIHAEDDTRSGLQATGKQAHSYDSNGCMYTRVTGIWQTVWLEAVAPFSLESCHIVPDIDSQQVTFQPAFRGPAPEKTLTFCAAVTLPDGSVRRETCAAVPGAALTVPLPEPRLWSPDDPYLYDVALELLAEDGTAADHVDSYFGMRKFAVRGNRFYLNNKPIYLRWVLDQGFYPAGVWTAPDDQALRQDIERSMAVGFNGARLHQKVFEERFHYWADRLGYLTSAEFPNWGIQITNPAAHLNFLREWREAVRRDRNHPSIVLWTPLNETRSVQHEMLPAVAWMRIGLSPFYQRFVKDLRAATADLDTTRPFHDASGYTHIDTDVWSVHPYVKDSTDLKKFVRSESGAFKGHFDDEVPYQGQPYFVDEWGGFRYVPASLGGKQQPGWGYCGVDPQSPEELCAAIRDQAQAMADDGEIAGWCYTQLTDVEQEQNGVYTYSRLEKGAAELFRDAFGPRPTWSAW